MIRHKPQLYLHALSILQDRCSQRQTPHNLSFKVEDVGFAIEMLNNLEPRAPLNLAEDLCDYSRNLLQNQLKIFPGGNQEQSINAAEG